MTDSIKKRIFIVGTARSGTTLLQNILASHSQIFSLPETHFFDSSLHQRNIVRAIDIIRNKHKKEIHKHLQEIGLNTSYLNDFSTPSFSKKKWGKFLLSIIDAEALKAGKSYWVEKTPRNLYYIEYINSLAENIKFIHIHRDPEDNIASLYEVGQKYSDNFKQQTLEQCIERYKKEYNISAKYIHNKNHCHVIYDELVDDLQKTSKKLCNFLEIQYEDSMLHYDKSTKALVVEKERWKAKNFRSITKEKKSEKLFSNNELEHLRKEIKNLDLGIFRDK